MRNECPICQSELVVCIGNELHLGDPKFGITVYCNNKECSAQEVSGHGNNLKDALLVVADKYGKYGKNNSTNVSVLVDRSKKIV